MNIITKKLFILLMFVNLILASAFASAKLNYTGMLNQSGTPVTGTKNITFKIYNNISSGSLLWSSGSRVINVVNGKFTYILGQDNDLNPDIFLNNDKIFIELNVDSETLSPREEILKLPYSQLAGSIYWDDIIDIPQNIKTQTIAANSIGSYHIMDSTITTSKIADGAVTDTKISSLSWSKLTNVPSNLGGTETDPFFKASVSSGIVSGDIAKWNSALQSGNNISLLTNDAGYLTAVSANSEPLFMASISSGIVSGDIAKWNSAIHAGNNISLLD